MQRPRNTLRALLAALAFLACNPGVAAVSALRPEAAAFADEVAARHGLDRAELRKLLQQAQPRPSIIRAMSTPGTARPWFDYRRRVVEPTRIENGVRFWLANAPALERAAREFGVPEELIVATIGIETLYGRGMGTFRLIDSLTTLAFDYPPRAELFRKELEEYVLLVREAGLDAVGTKGSYAGAIGIPQFLPSSYRKYAVDFDGDGRRDLIGSTADAIGSVANYYRSFGWQAGGAVVVPAESGDADIAPLIAAGIKPHIKVSELRKRGLVVPEPVDAEAEATLFFVQLEAGPKLLLGLNNFYVITRYNRSINYAMAVWELATEIRMAKSVR